jgi:hypothetical protein
MDRSDEVSGARRLGVDRDLVGVASIVRGDPSLVPFVPSAKSKETLAPEGHSTTGNRQAQNGGTGRTRSKALNRERVLSFSEAITAHSAVDADALGFMANFLVQTTLPHRAQPGAQYVRTDGHLTLSITDVGCNGLPYGSYPRLILIWMTTEAVRTRSRELALGSSLSSFMAQLGLQATGGHWGTIPRFRNQMQRLVGCAISTRWSSASTGQRHLGGCSLLVADEFSLWWKPQKLPSSPVRKSRITLSASFYDQISQAPVPLDLRAVRALKKSPLALDLYAWATRRVSYLSRPTLVPWQALRLSFGAGYADTPQGRSRFKEKLLEGLCRVAAVYPQLRAENEEKGLLLRPCPTHVAKVTR